MFQQFNLLPRLTALKNVMLPMIYANVSQSQRLKSATEALEQVGLGDRLTNRPQTTFRGAATTGGDRASFGESPGVSLGR